MISGASSEWKTVAIGEVATINPPKPKYRGLSDDDLVGFVPMAAVDEMSGAVVDVEERRLGQLRATSYRTFATNDVIFAKITPCMENGKAAVVPGMPNGQGFGSTEFHVIRPGDEVEARYIWRFIRQRSYRAKAEAHMTGSVGQLRVPADFLRESEIPLPSVEEQRRIVGCLDKIDGHRDIVDRRLVRARTMLVNFRKAVLAAACSGRLTEDWRSSHKLEAVGPSLKARRAELIQRKGRREYVGPPELEGRYDLPDTWAWASLGEVGSVQVGGTPSRKAAAYWGGTIAWVSSGEVANCRVFQTRETITDQGLANSNAKVYPIGTVLIAMIGEGKTRGQSAILDIGATTNQNAAGVLADSRFLDSEYLWRWALGQYENTRAVGHGGSQPALNARKVRELVIPLPPLEEQREIAERVDALLRSSESILTHVNSASRLVERVGEAAVTKAFRSELVEAAE